MGFPVTTAGEWPWNLEYSSRIQAMVWALVPMSGAGTSVWIPMRSWIFWVKTRVSLSSSLKLKSRGLHPIPPLAPPYGMSATAVFQVISWASAFTSSGSTFKPKIKTTLNSKFLDSNTINPQSFSISDPRFKKKASFLAKRQREMLGNDKRPYLRMISDSTFHGSTSIVMLNPKSDVWNQSSIVFRYRTLHLKSHKSKSISQQDWDEFSPNPKK